MRDGVTHNDEGRLRVSAAASTATMHVLGEVALDGELSAAVGTGERLGVGRETLASVQQQTCTHSGEVKASLVLLLCSRHVIEVGEQSRFRL